MLTRERFTQIAQTYMDTIFRVAFSYLKSREDADDAVQNALLALYRTDKDFSGEEHVKAWLIRVTVNECRKILRSPWRKRGEPLEDYEDTLMFQQPQDRELYAAIMDLDGKYRAVIVLYYYEGYSIRETARLLGVPPATAGTRLARAREQLRHWLTEVDR